MAAEKSYDTFRPRVQRWSRRVSRWSSRRAAAQYLVVGVVVELSIAMMYRHGFMPVSWQGFPEIVHYSNAVKEYCGDIDNEVESIFAQDHVPPQVCRLRVRLFYALAQAAITA